MSDHCCAAPPSATNDPKYRLALWIALVVNAFMFVIEIGGGIRSGSASLLADSVDFFGDAANYGVSLFVLSLGTVWRGRAAMLKGVCMAAFGAFVLSHVIWSISAGVTPTPSTMGAIGTLALLANLSVAFLLYAYREGDANMRSVWICTRNDAIGNVAVLIAAAGVFGTGSGWPDWAVAILMGTLALSGGIAVIRQARGELRAHHAH